MSGPGGPGRQPDLLASLPAERPGADPAALEGVRTALAGLRDEVAGLRAAVEAEGPAPATADALDAWGERLGERVDAAGGDAAAIAARAGAMTDAAKRIDAGLERLCVDLELRIEPLEGPPPRHLPEGVTAGDLDEAVEKMATRARVDYGVIADKIAGLRRDLRTMRVRRAYLAPWAVLVFVLGMALESRIHLLYRWFQAG